MAKDLGSDWLVACHSVLADFAENCTPEDVEMNVRFTDDTVTPTDKLPSEEYYGMTERQGHRTRAGVLRDERGPVGGDFRADQRLDPKLYNK